MNFLKNIRFITFGNDVMGGHYVPPPTKLEYGAKGDHGDTWITMDKAQAMVDAAMNEKGLFGLGKKYSAREDAEKAVAERLWSAKTAIKSA